ncbi:MULTISPECIES: hypothetical protein [unclassified Paenibacillus]|uniref:hypothetical protein n=1 Tax=unclassified Paenibacillus TaxID=185978 RepID=UPI000AD95931|nr:MULTISPECIES: hypothetical protein [unclassified Paenibacillus]
MAIINRKITRDRDITTKVNEIDIEVDEIQGQANLIEIGLGSLAIMRGTTQ